LNIPQADWNGEAEKIERIAGMCVNSLVWDNGHSEAVSGATRGDALLGVCLLRPQIALISCNILLESVTITRFYWN